MTQPDALTTARWSADRLYLDLAADLHAAVYDFLLARELAIHVCGGNRETDGYRYALAKRRELVDLLTEYRLLP